MITIKGIGVCGGIAFGKIELIRKTVKLIEKNHIENVSYEINRFEAARQKAALQLKELYDKALSEVGEENAMIFDIHSMMLEDEDYTESVKNSITAQKINAESAVAITADNFAQMFSSMKDSYMQARASDVRDISERLISILTDSNTSGIKSDEPVIICAKDLAPSETVQLDKSKILAFVTEEGSTNSHTSILARTMSIPAITGAEAIVCDEYEGADAIVDGYSGKIYINPDMQTVLKMQNKKHKSDEQSRLLQKLKGVEPKTKDGKKISIYANIGSTQDIPLVFANDAMGIGLFRSEFIYLEKDRFPTEDEQFEIYKNAAQKIMGKPLIIRTLDIGADKQIDYFQLPKEENPAMGVRAIRICLSRPNIFKTQLRALYRASAFGNIAIMFPMITSVSEVLQIKEICHQVRNELQDEGIHFNAGAQLGIMIETPAAALISDKLAQEVDFFSIGTNDLTQYALAIDRQNQMAEAFCDTRHTSILRMIKMVCDNAHKNGIWTGICGELAGDLSLTEFFLWAGVDELSVSPGQILPLKQKILDTTVAHIEEKAISLLK